jgi:hypothetical protein
MLSVTPQLQRLQGRTIFSARLAEVPDEWFGNPMKNLKRFVDSTMRFPFKIISLTAVSALLVFTLPRVPRAGASALPAADDGPRTPVLVELFTAEGCSSCPPADALLAKLDRSQPVNGAELIVLSEHVDYWNADGWWDPYSSHVYTERQNAYAARFAHGNVYTPQMVIDGHSELVGGDEQKAIQAVETETKFAKVPLKLSAIRVEGKNKLWMHVDAGPLAPTVTAHSADLFLAVADDSDESKVSHGENAGKNLKHVAVLRSLDQVGTLHKSDAFSKDISVTLRTENRKNLRIVAIIQESPVGRVFGVSSARLPD